jgi:MFS family permease
MINKTIKALYLYNGVFMLAASLLGPLYALYVSKFSVNPTDIGLSWGLYLFSSTICMFALTKYGDGIKRKRNLLLGGYLVRAIVWFLYISVGSLGELFLLQVILGIGEGLGSPAHNAIFAEHLDKGRHIQEFSGQGIIFNFIAAVAAVIGGFIVNQYGFGVLFVIMGFLALVSFFGILLEPKKII